MRSTFLQFFLIFSSPTHACTYHLLFAGMWRPLVSVITALLLCCDYFSSSLVSHAFSLLCVYSKFGHHPYALGYTFVLNSVSFATFIAELAHGGKSHTQSLSHSLTQLIWCPGNQSLHFGMIGYKYELEFSLLFSSFWCGVHNYIFQWLLPSFVIISNFYMPVKPTNQMCHCVTYTEYGIMI